MLGYRDSGMPDSEANADPEAFANADLDEAVGRLVAIIRRTRPQVILTYGDDQQGYPHPDHLRVHDITHPAVDARRRPGLVPGGRASRGRWRSSTTRSGRGSGSRPCTRSSSSSASSRRSADEWFDRPWQDDRITTSIDIAGYDDVRLDAPAGPRHPGRPRLAVLVRAAPRGVRGDPPVRRLLLATLARRRARPRRTTSSPACGSRRGPTPERGRGSTLAPPGGGSACRSGPGASARLQHVVTGAPDGEVAYSLTVVDGRVADDAVGRDDDAADCTFLITYPDAVRDRQGRPRPARRLHAGPREDERRHGAAPAPCCPCTQSDEYRAVLADGGRRHRVLSRGSAGPLEVAERPVADAASTPAASSARPERRRRRSTSCVVVDPAPPSRGDGRPQLGRVDGRVDEELGDAGPQVGQHRLEAAAATRRRGTRTKWSGNTTPSSAARRRNGKPTSRSVDCARQPQRQAELDGEVEVDVEELGPQLQRAHVAVEVADVEAPEDRPLDLGPELPAHLVEVGVVPQVGDACGGSRRRRRAATGRG